MGTPTLQFSLATPHRIFYRGEVVTFVLTLSAPIAGEAKLRTTIGMSRVRRSEIIAEVEEQRPAAGRGWQDIPMRRVSDRRFEIAIPLQGTGCYESKAFFIPSDGSAILWPAGDNIHLKTEAADNIGANILYAAFVRQFGPEMEQPHSSAPDAIEQELQNGDCAVLPPTGTFRSLKRRLDFLFDELGITILQLLPIHPVPTVYGRMGRFGSPFASLDYFAVDPALAEFDPAATPLEQFTELVDAVHAKNGRLFLDIPVNHTGWASRLQTEHPEWFRRENNGKFVSPGAWGVIWGDLCQLDYDKPEVFRYMAEVFLYWCRHGVDGFRCDAGYMLPEAAWTYIEAKVRNEYPNTVFLLEGLGGPQEKQEKLLSSCGLDWGYSELFQNEYRNEIEQCWHYADRSGHQSGMLMNFAETHDNNRLAAKSPRYAAVRCAIAALLSDAGGFGFANGVEWLAQEKIDVHGMNALNWGHEPNLVPLLRRLHAILREHPAFYGGAERRMVNLASSGAVVCFRKARQGDAVLALLNPDCANPQEVLVESDLLPGSRFYDLISGKEFGWTVSGSRLRTVLEPGGYALITADAAMVTAVDTLLTRKFTIPERVSQQRKAALALDLWLHRRHPDEELEYLNEAMLRMYTQRLIRGWRSMLDVSRSELPIPVIAYADGIDDRHEVMLPPGHFLAVVAKHAFHAELKNREKVLRESYAVKLDPELYLAVFCPLKPMELPETVQLLPLDLNLVVFEPGKTCRRKGHILYLGADEAPDLQMRFTRKELTEGPPRHALGTNQLGGYSQIPGAWGKVSSKYDALLAGNLNPDYPVDRRILFSRCKIWIVLDDFSHELTPAILDAFTAGLHNRSRWEFSVPVGRGQLIHLALECRTAFNTDAVRLVFQRSAGEDNWDTLPDDVPVKLILRPEIDDRINHEVTKAYAGPERTFPAAIAPLPDGFRFTPAPGRELLLTMPGSEFHVDGQWYYMTELPLEAYYGLEHQTDSYSPGYFTLPLSGGTRAELTAVMSDGSHHTAPLFSDDSTPIPATIPIGTAGKAILQKFVVRRQEFATVIAGYPWFLDWGRDTLIVLRGLLAAEAYDVCEKIIRQFASFEENGTIPNVIHGKEAANRDTSDAPLWLIETVKEYLQACPDSDILEVRCGKDQRKLREILCNIVEYYRCGTPNGIRMDPESALIFSPPHFTWMDTNYPAGTPREGYPVEIQALWISALHFLSACRPDCQNLAERAERSFLTLFVRPDGNGLYDCLHAAPGTPAAQAVPDTSIRPNQLLAVTLGAVRDQRCIGQIIDATNNLLIPGSIRSLADAPVSPPQPVRFNGRLLNNPDHPYIGHYRGPEDTSRKVAYHNGTAWGWLFPSFAEAFLQAGGDRATALRLLLSCRLYFDGGAPGFLPEVADGDWPHHWGGCAAQAWSASEFYRVWKLLQPAAATYKEEES